MKTQSRIERLKEAISTLEEIQDLAANGAREMESGEDRELIKTVAHDISHARSHLWNIERHLAGGSDLEEAVLLAARDF